MIDSLPGSSFVELLQRQAPHLLPAARLSGAPGGDASALAVPHGTTIVSATFDGGVALAGDRRATMGNLIASDGIEKVFITDHAGAVGIAGTAGLALEIVRLFRVELEHYEKIEGVRLSLEGRASRLATMLRGHLPLAMQGLAVLPLFAGYDERTATGRIYAYDITGGCYEEHDFHSIGSGAMFARGSLKKLWRPGASPEATVRVLAEALFDAADDDSATGGPDVARRIWPSCVLVDAAGARPVPGEELEAIVGAVVRDRRAGWEERR